MEPTIEYLYGDSTLSPLKTDYIAFLRDAFEFAAEVLLRDGLISDATVRITQLSDANETEIARAETLAVEVCQALDRATVGDRESLTARCRVKIRQGVTELVRSEADAARVAVATERTRTAQVAASAKTACARAFETLLLRQELPETATTIKVRLDGAGHYEVRVHGHTPYGLKWIVDVEAPPSHALERVLRIDRVVERLEVEAPEEAGWIHKEVKMRPQRFDRFHLAELTVGPTTTKMKLRVAPDGTGAGVDLSFSNDASRVELVRILDRGVGSSDSPYEFAPEEAAKLRPLHDALVALATDLAPRKRSLVSASLDETPIHQLETPRVLVERLILTIAPTVEQITRHSLVPGELVLKRRMGGNLREEVFVSKTELLKKLEAVPIRLRRAFEPLNLWPSTDPPSVPEVAGPSLAPVLLTPGETPEPAAKAVTLASPEILTNGGASVIVAQDDTAPASTGKWPALVLSFELDADMTAESRDGGHAEDGPQMPSPPKRHASGEPPRP
jgi:hypothetical protein